MANHPSIRRRRAHPGWHVLGGMLVVGWLMVMGWKLVGKPDRAAELVLAPADLAGTLVEGEEWMGVYHRGRKLGYLHSKIQPVPEGIRLNQEIRLAFSLGGLREQARLSMDILLTDGCLLKDFHSVFQSGFMNTQLKGNLEGDKLLVQIDFQGEISRLSINLGEPPLVGLAVPKLLARRSLQASQRFRINLFDPLSLSNQPTLIEVKGIEAVKSEGALVPGIHIRRTLAGQWVDTWIDEQGELLREEYAMGLVLQKEPAELATTRVEGLKIAGDRESGADILRSLFPGSSMVRSGP